jgi:phosphate acyltransferase
MTTKLPVAVDAMGGDLGASVAVEGAVRAAREYGVRSLLVGKEEELHGTLRQLQADHDSRIEVVHAPDIVTMEDSPSVAIRRKPRSSIRIAFQLVKEGRASAVVSAGNTGAVMAAGMFVVGTLPGIVRPAIATLIPKIGAASPTVLLDSGANTDCSVHQLVQFALMGKHYAQIATGRSSPRIALLSNGTEASKGTDVIRAAAQCLGEMPGMGFIGYVEGRDLPKDVADVVVCDGFVGNVVLKAMEGTVELVFGSLKHYVPTAGMRGKLGMWLAKPLFKTLFQDKLDPSSYGGAPLLGLNQIAIICHGSAEARAIMNALRVAETFHDQQLISKLEQAVGEIHRPGGGADANPAHTGPTILSQGAEKEPQSA